MGQYLFTTAMILFWCQLLSVVWIHFCYWQKRHPDTKRHLKPYHFHLPAIVIAPLTVMFSFHFLNWNLHFPVTFSVSTVELIFATLVPAAVLCGASGLFVTSRKTLHQEWSDWSDTAFAMATLARGQSHHRKLRRLVVFKTWVESWNHCLPWVFGELLIIEAIFNAPGLGLDTWEMAKMRDFGGLAESLTYLGGLYVAFYLVQAYCAHWLGKRLESYA